MPESYQYTLEDMAFQKTVDALPGRVAYIDECGGYGFDFSKIGTPRYYILTAIVVEDKNIDKLHSDFAEIKRTNGLADTELKSSKIDDKRRFRIMTQLMPVEFRIVLFIADKQKFHPESPLTEYKPVFIKYMNRLMYNILYQAYPKLKILMDETGYPEFQESFKKYVESQRGQINLFNQYDFDFINSKDEDLVQLADFIGGSVTKYLLDPTSTNYLEMLSGKITAMDRFPDEFEPYWGRAKPEDFKFDKTIYTLAIKKARDYIEANEKDESDTKRVQVAVLRYLLYYVTSVSSIQYVYADELIRNVQQYVDKKLTKDFLYRQVIAPLRDNGVILASCAHGYKIPISVDDILTYMNQTTSIVGPMMHRMGMCRKLIKEGTDGNLDMFDDPAFLKYKRYFED